MASSPEAAALTEAHRRAQAELGLETFLRLQQLSPLLDVEDFDGTTAQWLDAAERVVTAQHRRSSSVSRAYFKVFRQIEHGEAWLGTLPDSPVSVEALRTSLLVTGPYQARTDTARGLDLTTVMDRLVARTGQAGARHALLGGRGALLGATQTDRQAIGYARVTDNNPCAFCALLASRGPVYKSAQTALNRHRGGRYHDGCQCTAEPVYSTKTAWPGRAQEFQALYQQSTRGFSGQDAVNAFRRAYEHA